MKSLKFKFQNGLLHIADIVHEQEFLSLLFHWFDAEANLRKDPTVIEQVKELDSFVLETITLLCAHPNARETIVKRLNGVKVLQDLRSQVPEYSEQVEKALKSLLTAQSLPTASAVDESVAALTATVANAAYGIGAPVSINTAVPTEEMPFKRQPSPDEKFGNVHAHITQNTGYQAHETGGRLSPSGAMTTNFWSVFNQEPLINPMETVKQDIPRLKHAGHVPFEYIHLSHTDEKFLLDFTSMVRKSQTQTELRGKCLWGLDVLCSDFGSQIFLQRTQLLHVVLDGLKLGTGLNHQIFAISAILKIVQTWSTALRQAADSFGRHKTSLTFANNTPDVSYSATNMADMFPSRKEDMEYSLPYACLVIFDALWLAMKDVELAYHIIPILYEIAPFLKLYLISVCGSQAKESVSGENINFDTFKNALLYFMERYLDAQLWFERQQDSLADHGAKEFEFITTLLVQSKSYLITSLFSPSIVETYPMNVFEIFCELVDLGHTDLCGRLIELALTRPEYSFFICFMLQHRSNQVRLTVSEGLKFFFNQNMYTDSINDKEVVFQMIFAASIENDETVSQSLFALINMTMSHWQFSDIVSQYLPIIQASYVYDHGKLMNKFIKQFAQSIHECDYLTMTLRGLLHKDEEYRQYSAKILSEILQDIKGKQFSEFALDNVENSFIFSSNDLTEFAQFGIAGMKATTRFDDNVDMASHLTEMLQFLTQEKPINEYGDSIEAVYWSVKNEERYNEFLENGGPLMLGKLFERFTFEAIDEELIRKQVLMIRMIYDIIEFVDVAALFLVENFDILTGLACMGLTSSESRVRYEIARVLTRLLFDHTVIRSSKSRTQIADFESMISVDGTKLSHGAVVPVSWSSMYNLHSNAHRLYGIFTNIPSLNNDHVSNFLPAFRQVIQEFSNRQIPAIIEKLHHSESHADFLHQMTKFELIISAPETILTLDCNQLVLKFSKFLEVLPACVDDCVILGEILNTFSRIISLEVFKKADWKIVTRSVKNIILPILKQYLQKNDEVVDLFSPISTEIIGFLLKFLDHSPVSECCRLFAESDLLDLLRVICFKFFSSKQFGVADRAKRIGCLRAIARVTSIPRISSQVSSKHLIALNSVLTHTIGCLQQSFGSPDNFTYQNRTVYSLGVICIRNISCLLSQISACEDPSNSWLFENSLDWLVNLLSDDEVRIQAVALGIISNLVLKETTYEKLSQRIPDFFGMALSFAVDQDRHPKIRKEACLILANFVDFHAKTDGRFVSDDFNLFVEFENATFFDKLSDVLDLHKLFTGYPSALIFVFLNIAKTFPEQCDRKFSEYGLWEPLLNFFMTFEEITQRIFDESVIDGNDHGLKEFRADNFWQYRGSFVIDSQCLLLNILSLLCTGNNSRTLQFLMQNPQALATITNSIFSMIQNFEAARLQKISSLVCRFTDFLMDFNQTFTVKDVLSPFINSASIERLLELASSEFSKFGESSSLDFLSLLAMDSDMKLLNVSSIKHIIPHDSKAWSLTNLIAEYLLSSNSFDWFYLQMATVIELNPSIAGKVQNMFAIHAGENLDKMLEFNASQSKSGSGFQNGLPSKDTLLKFVALGLSLSSNCASTDQKYSDFLSLFLHTCLLCVTNANNSVAENVISDMIQVVVWMKETCEKNSEFALVMNRSKKIDDKSSCKILTTLISTLEYCWSRPSSTHRLFDAVLRLIAEACVGNDIFTSYMIKNNALMGILVKLGSVGKTKFKSLGISLLHFSATTCSNPDIQAHLSASTQFTRDIMHIFTGFTTSKSILSNKNETKTSNMGLFGVLSTMRHLGFSKDFRIFCLSNNEFANGIISIVERLIHDKDEIIIDDILEVAHIVITIVWVFVAYDQKSRASIRKTQIMGKLDLFRSKVLTSDSTADEADPELLELCITHLTLLYKIFKQ